MKTTFKVAALLAAVAAMPGFSARHPQPVTMEAFRGTVAAPNTMDLDAVIAAAPRKFFFTAGASAVMDPLIARLQDQAPLTTQEMPFALQTFQNFKTATDENQQQMVALVEARNQLIALLVEARAQYQTLAQSVIDAGHQVQDHVLVPAEAPVVNQPLQAAPQFH